MNVWLARFSIKTRRTYRAYLRTLLRDTGVTHPRQLTAADVADWTTNAPTANNTARNRWSVLRGFLTWCARRGEYDADNVDEACDPIMVRRVPRTHCRVQGQNPARWLTSAECAQLVATCAAGAPYDQRDEMVRRLGLLGLRATRFGRSRTEPSRPTVTPSGSARVASPARSPLARAS
jgi:site-specific recombinase XerC